jgi:hypothetical protein
VKEFEDEEKAKIHLRQKGFSDADIYWLVFEEAEPKYLGEATQ